MAELQNDFGLGRQLLAERLREPAPAPRCKPLADEVFECAIATGVSVRNY